MKIFAALAIVFLAGTAHAEGRLLGYLPSTPEERAGIEKLPRYRGFVPTQVDLSKQLPRPGDQGTLNSCTGWAVGYAARAYYTSAYEKRDVKKARNIPSPNYIYHMAREDEDCKNGSKLPLALLQMRKGSLSLAEYPYRQACKRVPAEQSAKASDFKIDGFAEVDPQRIDDVKAQLAEGNPVMFGMEIGDNFEHLKGASVYSGSPKFTGGHAMTAVGYDDRKQAIKVINSWGRSWGERGYGWIHYEAFVEQVREAYVMKVEKPAPQAEPEPPPLIVVTPREKPEVPQEPVVEPATLVVVEEAPPPTPPVKPKVADTPPPPPESPVAENPAPRREECARLFSADNRTLTGFVESEKALEELKARAAKEYARIEVEVRPWPLCEVLKTLEAPLKARDRPEVAARSAVFKKGETMPLSVTSPRQPGFLYVSYVQADGTVVQLAQPRAGEIAAHEPRQQLSFGDGADGRSKFTATSPYGRELVVVLSSASPLFDAPLPARLSEREYLSALRKALLYKADPKLPDRVLSAGYLAIETRETGP